MIVLICTVGGCSVSLDENSSGLTGVTVAATDDDDVDTNNNGAIVYAIDSKNCSS